MGFLSHSTREREPLNRGQKWGVNSRTGGPCLALDEVHFLDHRSWSGGCQKSLLSRLVQLRQVSRMLYGLHESTLPDPPSCHLVLRREGQHTCAIVSSVVGCMRGYELDANEVNR